MALFWHPPHRITFPWKLWIQQKLSEWGTTVLLPPHLHIYNNRLDWRCVGPGDVINNIMSYQPHPASAFKMNQGCLMSTAHWTQVNNLVVKYFSVKWLEIIFIVLKTGSPTCPWDKFLRKSFSIIASLMMVLDRKSLLCLTMLTSLLTARLCPETPCFLFIATDNPVDSCREKYILYLFDH